MWSIWLRVFPSGEVQVYLRMFRCRNIVLLKTRFLAVTRFTIITPLSLVSWCILSFSIVVFKIPVNFPKTYLLYGVYCCMFLGFWVLPNFWVYTKMSILIISKCGQSELQTWFERFGFHISFHYDRHWHDLLLNKYSHFYAANSSHLRRPLKKYVCLVICTRPILCGW